MIWKKITNAVCINRFDQKQIEKQTSKLTENKEDEFYGQNTFLKVSDIFY